MDDPVPASAGGVDVAFPGAQTAGDLNVVIVGWSNGTSTISSVSDTAGNTYLQAVGTRSTGAVSQAVFYAKNIKAAASNTVTVTFNQSTSFPDVRIFEYSGVDTTAPLDATTGNAGSATPATVSLTTTAASDVVVVGGTTTGGFGKTATGFTVELFNNSTSDIAGDKFPVSPGAFNGSDTSSGSYVIQAAAFGSAPTTFTAPTLNPTTPITQNAGADTGNQGVKISGSNFAPGAVVLFGNGTTNPPTGVSGVNCSVVSSTEIDCLTPAHTAGTVDVIVMNPDGQFASATGAFTFDPTIPVVSSVTFAAGSNTTNGNTSITINGNNFLAPASVTIGSEPANNVIVVSATQITANTPAGAVGPADVSVKNGDGGGPTTLAGGYTYIMGSGPVNFVQANDHSQSTGAWASLDVAMPHAQLAGDLSVVVVGWGDTGTHTVTVTDSAGNTYAQALSVATNPGKSLSQGIWYAKNIVGSASNTIHVAFSPNANTPDVRVMEYKGLDPSSPLDTNPASASTKFGTSALADSGAVTTTTTNNLIVAAAMVGNTVAGAAAPFANVLITQNKNNAEHQINGNPVSGVDPAATLIGSQAWVMQAVTFHAPANLAPPGFTMSVSTPGAVNPGSSASATITVTSANGFTGAVALSCSVANTNAGIGCSVTPKSVTPGTPATLTITTTGPTAALMAPRNGHSLLPLYAVWLPLPGIALVGVGLGSNRRKLGLGMALFLVLAFTLLLFGCGGGGSSSGGGGGGGGGGTAAGSYQITVNGTSPGATTQTSTVTLTVN